MLNSLNLSASTLEAIQNPRTSRLGVVLAVLEGQNNPELPARYINQSLPARVLQNNPDGTSELQLNPADLQDNTPLIVQARLQQPAQAGSQITLQLSTDKALLDAATNKTTSHARATSASELTATSSSPSALDTPESTSFNRAPLSPLAQLVNFILEKGDPKNVDTLIQQGVVSVANSELSAVSTANTEPAVDVAAAVKTLAPHEATQKIAQGLAHTVEKSGLFYEAHLQDWAAGTRPLAALQQEPQAQFTANNPNSIGTPPTTLNDANQVNNQPNSQITHLVPPAGLLALVREQLQVLDTRSVLTQFQAWPGQDTELGIQEAPEYEQPQQPPRAWQARLKLQLPNLGEIDAQLTLHGQGVQFRLNTPNESTLSLLDTGKPGLANALEAAGLHMTQWQLAAVDQHGE